MAVYGKKYPVSNCAVIILAAGQSSRLGEPKQLLNFKGKNLLQNAIDVAKQASMSPVIVVLGSEFELIAGKVDTDGVHLIKNNDWHTGMASSIIYGIKALENIDTTADAAILMVCDQPFVTAKLLSQLLSAQEKNDKPITASKYDDIIGIPALFHKELFPQLLQLTGDTGAKKFIQQNTGLLATVPFPSGSIDIDTLDDYRKLK